MCNKFHPPISPSLEEIVNKWSVIYKINSLKQRRECKGENLFKKSIHLLRTRATGTDSGT
jgi:hypothetical protein